MLDSAPSTNTLQTGLFGPGSMTWLVDREIAVLLGSGARALLLQVAHPMVAAAVADHSRYRSDPLGRLRDTLDAIYAFRSFARDRPELMQLMCTRPFADFDPGPKDLQAGTSTREFVIRQVRRCPLRMAERRWAGLRLPRTGA